MSGKLLNLTSFFLKFSKETKCFQIFFRNVRKNGKRLSLLRKNAAAPRILATTIQTQTRKISTPLRNVEPRSELITKNNMFLRFSVFSPAIMKLISDIDVFSHVSSFTATSYLQVRFLIKHCSKLLKNL